MAQERTGSQVSTEPTVSSGHDGGFYQLRVDARGVPLPDSLYEIAEKLLASELESAQRALDRLWELRKQTQNENSARVIQSLVGYYDSRLTTLRTREDQVRRVSTRSHDLLEQQQKGRARLSQVRKDLDECERRLRDLVGLRDKLGLEERELAQTTSRLEAVLAENEREVVTALREIIVQVTGTPAAAQPSTVTETAAPVIDRHAPVGKLRAHEAAPPLPVEQVPETLSLAKSVVKTTRGRVLGEFFYDASLAREARHYVYNGRFLLEQLSLGIDMLVKDYDKENHAELAQMVQDAVARVSKLPNIHFEVSTADVVNRESLGQVFECIRQKRFDEAGEFCRRLRDKIDNLGPGYRRLLKAQMDKLAGRLSRV